MSSQVLSQWSVSYHSDPEPERRTHLTKSSQKDSQAIREAQTWLDNKASPSMHIKPYDADV